MLKKYTYFILAIVFFLSCKKDEKSSNKTAQTTVESISQLKEQRQQDSLAMVQKYTTSGREVDAAVISRMLEEAEKSNLRTLPQACDLLTAAQVNNVFDVGEFNILQTDGKRRSEGNENSTSCFWRWTGGGVLVQISRNPLPDEVDDWCTRYINTKKSSGENSQQGRFMYKDFDGPGTMNIYNRELARFYSTLQERYIVTLIFNGNMDAKKQIKAAQSLMSDIFKNL